jgi:Flp pilus assembly protein TadG
MMSPTATGRTPTKGQILALFALSLTVILLAVGLVIDGGNALVQRRSSQNAADLAALAGARLVASKIDGDTLNGTDANVRAAIQATATANGGTVTFGVAGSPQYISQDGATLGFVGTGTIPANAVGVTVPAARTFDPYFLGIIGASDWTASANATARGGYAVIEHYSNVFPIAVAEAFFENYPFCSGAVNSSPDCVPQKLTPGHLNVPGGFGWLKFGAADKCAGYGLGMIDDGCDPNKPFLQEQIGPPGKSYGCCDVPTGGAAPVDRIGSLTGNKASADCSYYIDNEIVVTVPVFDSAGGTGANAWYHIVGFAGFQLTDCNGGKDIQGVWRKQIFLGPTSATKTDEFSSLAVQLVK